MTLPARAALAAMLAFLLLAISMPAAAMVPQINWSQLDKLERALELTPGQKEQYDIAIGATKRMAFHVVLAGMQMKERLQAELAKERPDFSVLADLRRMIVEEGRPLRREARQEWLKLYAMLSDDQVATLKRFLEERADLGLLHQFMTDLILGRERI
jgi:hypothetical protein